MSPSVQTVLCTLHGHQPMTGQQIREETGLPRRTVYGALKAIRAFGVLKERVSLKDTRQTFFWLAEEKLPAHQHSQVPTEGWVAGAAA